MSKLVGAHAMVFGPRVADDARACAQYTLTDDSSLFRRRMRYIWISMLQLCGGGVGAKWDNYIRACSPMALRLDVKYCTFHRCS